MARYRRTKNNRATNKSSLSSKVLVYLVIILIGLCLCTYYNYESGHQGEKSENWALLVSGSVGYVDYRHEVSRTDYILWSKQIMIMPTYATRIIYILMKNGFKKTNVIVFMGDVAAHHGQNPRKGTLINHPNGLDYYHGVIKDYAKENATAENLLAVLLGDQEASIGGSRKVIKSGALDRIFIFYSDHGNNNFLQLPSPRYKGVVNKDTIISTLEQMHFANRFQSVVFYINACRAGELFNSISPRLNVYLLTCSGPRENSKGAYCEPSEIFPVRPPYAPPDYTICLASQFGAAWMEHSEEIDPRDVSLQEQFEIVKQRVWSSTVHQYGDRRIAKEKLSSYTR